MIGSRKRLSRAQFLKVVEGCRTVSSQVPAGEELSIGEFSSRVEAVVGFSLNPKSVRRACDAASIVAGIKPQGTRPKRAAAMPEGITIERVLASLKAHRKLARVVSAVLARLCDLERELGAKRDVISAQKMFNELRAITDEEREASSILFPSDDLA